MLKKLLSLLLTGSTGLLFAAQSMQLHHAPLSRLQPFFAAAKTNKAARASSVSSQETLRVVNQTQEKKHLIKRYQQMYRGIPIVGAQVMVSQDPAAPNHTARVNGQLFTDIDVDTHPTLSIQEALALAKKSWFAFNPQLPIHAEQVTLQLRNDTGNRLTLTYLVSFKGLEADNKPAWPFFVIDAHRGHIMQQWNNLKHFADSGPGGNEKVQQYWYGQDGLPSLVVKQEGDLCTMENAAVKLVHLHSAWDWDNTLTQALQYPCRHHVSAPVNGAFSPENDAYYFGQTVVDFYRQWYGVNALQHTDGSPMQLVMRVHFGEHYDNAFWDGQSMSFGDGADFYPLVSLDIAAHEITHGFTEQHANLEYHDESGALNESLSDMAGQAARAFLLEQFPQLYNRAYLQPDTLTWGIGETVVRDSFGKALRFMDYPSSDGSSADCLDKDLAQRNGAYCAISYAELREYAQSNIPSPQMRQSFIVHTASGIFNKAFYLLAQTLSVKKAYQLMLTANSKYWTPTTNFQQGACGVMQAAADIAVDPLVVKMAFAQVGIDTANCQS